MIAWHEMWQSAAATPLHCLYNDGCVVSDVTDDLLEKWEMTLSCCHYGNILVQWHDIRGCKKGTNRKAPFGELLFTCMPHLFKLMDFSEQMGHLKMD